MKECKYCRTQYDDNLTVCPNCGGSKIVTEDEIAEEKAYKELEAEYREKANAAPEIHKKRLVGSLVALVAVVIVVIAIFSAISNKPLSNGMTKNESEDVLDTGKEYLENGEYEKAMEYFLKLPADSKQYSEAQALLEQSKESYREKIIDTVNNYITNNDYDSAFNLIGQAQEILPSDSELNSAYGDVCSAYRSSIKTRVDTHVSKGEYDAAFNLINQAQEKLPDDADLQTTYDNTYSAYQLSVLQQVDAYVTEGQYELALEYLNGIQEEYPSDIAFQDSYNSTLATYHTTVRNTAIEQADEYVAEGDYPNAIKIIKAALDIIGEDGELAAKLNVYSEVYSASVIKLARDQYIECNYDSIVEAERILREALSVIPNMENLQSEIDFYKQKEPTSVTELPYVNFGLISGSIYGLEDFGEITDNYGNVHDNSLCPNGWTNGDYARIVGDLDYQYSKITGIVFQNKKYSTSPVVTTVSILGYATSDVYDATGLWSGEISGDTKPINIDVDLTGYKYIEIRFSRSASDTSLLMFVSDLYVWK